MASTLSMRKLWKLYRKTMVEAGASKSEIALAYEAFYSGGRGVRMVLDSLKKRGEMDELHRTTANRLRRFERERCRA